MKRQFVRHENGKRIYFYPEQRITAAGELDELGNEIITVLDTAPKRNTREGDDGPKRARKKAAGDAHPTLV